MRQSKLLLSILVLVLLSGTLLKHSTRAAADAPACQAFETVSPGNKIYNDLVCQAVKDFEQENYGASTRRLEEAARLNLFEFPNFKILPLLALSYHRAGEKKKALKTLEQARVSLLIANGEIECVETDIESSYQPDAKVGDPSNIKNQIVAYIPGRLLVLKIVQAPEGFAPEGVMDRLVSIFEFESISEESTRLTLWGVGYGPDEESLRILEFFKEANAWTFGQLQALLTGGPGDPEGFEQFVKPSN